MKKIILLIMFFMILPIVSAEPDYIFKKSTTATLYQPCFNSDNSYCSNSTDCRITLNHPDGNILLNNELMNYDGGVFNYTIGGGNLSVSGNYIGIMHCNSSTENGNDIIYIEVNFSGSPRENILPLSAAISFFAILFIAVGLILFFWRGEENQNN